MYRVCLLCLCAMYCWWNFFVCCVCVECTASEICLFDVSVWNVLLVKFDVCCVCVECTASEICLFVVSVWNVLLAKFVCLLCLCGMYCYWNLFVCCVCVECTATEIPDYAVQKQTKHQRCTKMLSRVCAVSWEPRTDAGRASSRGSIDGKRNR
jgi:hypothetical protein